MNQTLTLAGKVADTQRTEHWVPSALPLVSLPCAVILKIASQVKSHSQRQGLPETAQRRHWQHQVLDEGGRTRRLENRASITRLPRELVL